MGQINRIQKTRIYLIALFLLLSLVSQGQDVEYEEIKFGCLNYAVFNKETVITSDDEYEAMLKNISPISACISYTFPKIDFNKKVLLGFLIKATGCQSPKIDFKIFKSENKVIFNVDVIEYATCRSLKVRVIWVTISKEFEKQVSFVSNYKKFEY